MIVVERKRIEGNKVRLSYNFVPKFSIPDLSSFNLTNAAQKLALEELAELYKTSDGSMDKAYDYKLQNVRRGVNTDWIHAPLRVQPHALAGPERPRPERGLSGDRQFLGRLRRNERRQPPQIRAGIPHRLPPA